MHPDAWLVVIDPQRIFASPDSQWGSPMFPDIVDPVRRLAAAAGERTVVTRWVPDRDAQGSWAAYLEAWPFADVPDDDPLLDLVPEVAGLTDTVVSLPTFGKWGPELRPITGPLPAPRAGRASRPTAASSRPRSPPPTPARRSPS